MGKECVVFGCRNRDTEKGSSIKFHRIPKSEPRRGLWLRAIHRKDQRTGKDWTPGDYGARVCSEHFIEGKNDDANSPDYVPTVNLGYSTPFHSNKEAMDRFKRFQHRNTNTNSNVKRQLQLSFEIEEPLGLTDISTNTVSNDVEDVDMKENQAQVPQDSEVTTNHDSCIKLLAKANIEKKQLMQELERLQIANVKLKEAKPFLRAIYLTKSDEQIIFHTGIPSYKCFEWLSKFINNDLPSSTILNSEDKLLLVFMKLRLNLTHKDLSYRFGVSPSHVSNIIDKGLVSIADNLKFLIHWPQKDDIFRTRPQCFKESYPKCVSIIDCTEVFIESPSNFCARSATYSNYKHSNTIKFLVSIVPCGGISFVSQAFGGRTSDKVITYRSGYLDFINHGDVVMADRGFLIQDELASRGAELVMPSFVKGKSQLSAREVETSRRIANVRIHVERAMERLKNFRILSNKMPMNMVPHADSVMTVCAAVSNLLPNLVKN